MRGPGEQSEPKPPWKSSAAQTDAILPWRLHILTSSRYIRALHLTTTDSRVLKQCRMLHNLDRTSFYHFNLDDNAFWFFFFKLQFVFFLCSEECTIFLVLDSIFWEIFIIDRVFSYIYVCLRFCYFLFLYEANAVLDLVQWWRCEKWFLIFFLLSIKCNNRIICCSKKGHCFRLCQYKFLWYIMVQCLETPKTACKRLSGVFLQHSP